MSGTGRTGVLFGALVAGACGVALLGSCASHGADGDIGRAGQGGANGPVASADPLTAGRDAMARGDPSAAAAQFNRALQLDPNDPVALNNLAVAKANSGDYRTALDLFRRAAAGAPGREDIAANLAHYQQWLDRRATVPLESPGLDNAPMDPDMGGQDVPGLWGSDSSGGTNPMETSLVPK